MSYQLLNRHCAYFVLCNWPSEWDLTSVHANNCVSCNEEISNRKIIYDTELSGGGESRKIRCKPSTIEKQTHGHCQYDENSADTNKSDYKRGQDENRPDMCRFQEWESNPIFSTEKQQINYKKPRNPEKRTGSAKSEEEAATTIQAVYRGYKARRRFNETIRSTSDEKQNLKKVADLLAIPFRQTMKNSTGPIRVSNSSISQNKNKKDVRRQFLSLKKKRREPSSARNKNQSVIENFPDKTNDTEAIEMPEEQAKENIAENTTVQISAQPFNSSKPITTIKSPAFFCNYDERTNSVSPSDNTDTEDTFSPRIQVKPLTTDTNDNTENDVANRNVTDFQVNHDIQMSKSNENQAHAASFKRPLPQRISSSMLSCNPESYFFNNSLFFLDRESILVFGGIDPHEEYDRTGNAGKYIYRFKPDENIWESVGEIPEARYHHSVTYLKGRIYIVGGADPREDEFHRKSIALKTVWSYDPTTRTWLDEPGMLIARKNFGLVVSHGKMYAMGGQNKNGIALKNVEAFDPSDRTWREMQPMYTARVGPASVKYRDLIWVAGGMTKSKKELFSRDVECYDPIKNLWLKAVPLKTSRCFASLYVISDCLYLIGGASTTDNGAQSIDNIEIWDTNSCTWKEQANMSVARHGHTTASIGDQLLIIGGVTTVFMKTLSSVECYCCDIGKWMKGVSALPCAISGHATVTLPPANLLTKHE